MIRSLIIMDKSFDQDKRFRLTFKVKEDGVHLREFLGEKDISKRTLTATKYEGGRLSVNGIERDVRHILSAGDEVEILFPPEELSSGLIAEEGELDIIYEDEAILILNKPPGQSTIPSFNHRLGTIANYVAGKFLREGIPSTVHVVTRLDLHTSGLLCIAKNRHIHHLLGTQIENAGFHRQYEAIVEGHVAQNEFLINERIGRKDGSIIERIVRSDGKEARTEVQVLKRFKKEGCKLTKVGLTLHTGRTHQIRVHMHWAGHSLAGDDLYGGSEALITRQALHCSSLAFNHPITGERKRFTGAMPADMREILT